ncbi:hypothetical protein CISIN_1g0327842mg, partial [Citrus sinensis]
LKVDAFWLLVLSLPFGFTLWALISPFWSNVGA